MPSPSASTRRTIVPESVAKTAPPGPSASERTPPSPSAKRLTLKPLGTYSAWPAIRIVSSPAGGVELCAPGSTRQPSSASAISRCRGAIRVTSTGIATPGHRGRSHTPAMPPLPPAAALAAYCRPCCAYTPTTALSPGGIFARLASGSSAARSTWAVTAASTSPSCCAVRPSSFRYSSYRPTGSRLPQAWNISAGGGPRAPPPARGGVPPTRDVSAARLGGPPPTRQRAAPSPAAAEASSTLLPSDSALAPHLEGERHTRDNGHHVPHV